MVARSGWSGVVRSRCLAPDPGRRPGGGLLQCSSDATRRCFAKVSVGMWKIGRLRKNGFWMARPPRWCAASVYRGPMGSGIPCPAPTTTVVNQMAVRAVHWAVQAWRRFQASQASQWCRAGMMRRHRMAGLFFTRIPACPQPAPTRCGSSPTFVGLAPGWLAAGIPVGVRRETGVLRRRAGLGSPRRARTWTWTWRNPTTCSLDGTARRTGPVRLACAGPTRSGSPGSSMRGRAYGPAPGQVGHPPA